MENLSSQQKNTQEARPSYNGHGPTWSVHDQTWPTTKNESKLVAYRHFHINGHGPTWSVSNQTGPQQRMKVI